MASNQLPTNSAQLIGLGTKNQAGLVALGTTLGITQITPAQFLAKLTAFITADGEANAARSAQRVASETYKASIVDVSDWLQETRNVLAARFGSRWSTLWAQAGFIAPSTKVPVRIEEKLGLALSLKGFFTANPSYEVASMNVTAAEAGSLRDAAITAQQTFAAAQVTQKVKVATAGVAKRALMSMMRALLKILGASLAADDPRWQTFGFNMPAADTTPGQPQNVTASLTENGDIMVDCDAVAFGLRYRFRMLRVGIDTEYTLAASSTQPLGIISNVLPGQTARIIVQAVNGSQQGVASEPIDFTVPLPAAQTIEPKATFVAPKLEEVLAPNGSGNGHTVPARV
jgi:hypothetical protein